MLISWRKPKTKTKVQAEVSEPDTSSHLRDSLVPISVNQEEQELRLIVSKRTTWLGSEPWLMATHTRGYSCSGTTSISNTFRGLGSGKSKCYRRGKDSPQGHACQSSSQSPDLGPASGLSRMLTLMSMNLCMGSYHCSSTIPDCRAPHRYLWPVYGFLTGMQTRGDKFKRKRDVK